MLYKKKKNCSSNFYKTQDKNGFTGLLKKSWNKYLIKLTWNDADKSLQCID